MQETARPIVAVSKCLEFEACNCDGKKVRADLVRGLMPHVNFKPVCVEVEIGLGVPRPPLRLVMAGGRPRLVQPSTGRDVTASAVRFTDRFLQSLAEVDGFILKSRSPTCGIKSVKVHFDAKNNVVVRQGHGLFAAAIVDRFPHLPVEDHSRLADPRRSEHFLTSLFTIASFRALAKDPSFSGLIEFHSRNKLLFMAYSKKEASVLTESITEHKKKPAMEIIGDYEEGLYRTLARPPLASSMAGALMHVFEDLRGELSPAEQQSFLDLLEQYRLGQVPLSRPRALLQEWTERQGMDHLKLQSILRPYPSDLAAHA